ncbi:WD40 repeat domain-containing protein [Symbioplanes lichenis]|uniref:WD40 repeat domain-containing protein n=1 Tax=Symbioplanes lichenis TaxID=1629072 RepID=UPI0027384204|nr:WD40 repeat domain-containing protein [Actinoplanes lichenis]
MSDESGWVEDSTRPPHLLLRTRLGTLRPETIRTASANGRELLVFAGVDDEALPVRFVELDSGVLLPDRSLLHSAELAALGPGAGRALLATVTGNGTVAVRDARTGVPVGPAIAGLPSPRGVTTFMAGGRELVAVIASGRVRSWDVGDGSQVAGQDFGGVALVVHGERLLAAEGTGLVRDVLTGESSGEPVSADGPIVAAVVHRDRVLVVSAGATVRVWSMETGREVTLPELWPADRPGENQLHRLALAAWGDGLAAAVTWRTPAGADRSELWVPGDGGPRLSPLPDGDAVAVLAWEGQLVTAVAGPGSALTVSGASSPFFGGPVRSFGGWARRGGRMLAVLTGEPASTSGTGPTGRATGGTGLTGGEPAMLYDIETGLPYARLPLPADGTDGPLEIVLDGGGFRVRDSFTGRELLRRDGQDDAASVAVTAAAIRDTDDDALLATGGADGSVRVWKVSAREPAGGPWSGHTGPVTAVAVTRWRGRQAVVSADGSGTVRTWLVDGPVRHAGHPDEVTAVAGGFLGGRAVFASGGRDGTIRFWDPVTAAGAAEPIRCGPVTGLVFAGDILVSADEDGTVQRWKPATGEPLARREPATGEPLARREPATGEPLARREPATGERLGAPLTGSGRVASAEFDGRTLVAAVAGARLQVWDAVTGTPFTTIALPEPAKLQDLAADGGRLLALTVGPPDKTLFPEAAGFDSEQLTLWDVTAAEPVLRMLTGDDGGHGAFGRVGGRLVAAHGVDARKNAAHGEGVWPEETGDIYLRDVATGELRASFRPDAGFNQQLLLTRAGDRDLVLVAADSAVQIRDATTGNTVAPPMLSATGTFTCVAAIEENGHTYAAAGDAAGTVRIWELTPHP